MQNREGSTNPIKWPRLRDLCLDQGTKTWSHTKLWANVGYGVLTVAFLRQSWTLGVDAWSILAYGSVVCGSAAASKWLSLRYYANGGVGHPRADRGDSGLPVVDGPRADMDQARFHGGSG